MQDLAFLGRYHQQAAVRAEAETRRCVARIGSVVIAPRASRCAPPRPTCQRTRADLRTNVAFTEAKPSCQRCHTLLGDHCDTSLVWRTFTKHGISVTLGGVSLSTPEAVMTMKKYFGHTLLYLHETIALGQMAAAIDQRGIKPTSISRCSGSIRSDSSRSGRAPHSTGTGRRSPSSGKSTHLPTMPASGGSRAPGGSRETEFGQWSAVPR